MVYACIISWIPTVLIFDYLCIGVYYVLDMYIFCIGVDRKLKVFELPSWVELRTCYWYQFPHLYVQGCTE